MEVTTIPTGQGFKGVTMYRSINYNIPRGLYNKWLPSIEPLRCCQLLSDQQYEPDSIEDYVCRNNLEYVVQNSFPNAYPNGLCREVLQEHCNNKDNIDEDLCKMACGMSGELLKMSVADDSYVKSHEPPPLTYTAAGLPVIVPELMSVREKLFASIRVMT